MMAAQPKQAPKRACFAENVERHVLDNGLTLLVMENPGRDVVAISGNTKAGGYFSQPSQRVLPSLTYSLLTRGSSKYTKLELGELLEEMGASLGFSGDYFTVNFGAAVVSEDLPKMIDIVANVLREPLWPQEELSKAKKEFVSYFLQEMNDTASIAKSRLCQALYEPGSPYYAPPYEELIEQLEHIEADALRDFHLKYYNPSDTILSIVGNISAKQAVELVTEKFGNWSSAAGTNKVSITVPPTKLPDKAQTIEIPMPDKANVDIRIGLPCSLKRNAPDYFATRLANAALGQDTLSSRLGVEIRERAGLTYGIHSRFDDLAFGGAPWNIDLSTNPENVDKALHLVKKVVSEYIRDGITPEELSAEAGRATGNFQLALRTSLGIAAAVTQHEFLGLGFAAIDNFPASVAAVTKEQADAAIAKYLQLDRCVTTVAGSLAKAAV
jgi:zinc protease